MATQIELPNVKMNFENLNASMDSDLTAKMAKMELKSGNLKLTQQTKEKKDVQLVDNVPVPKDLKELVQMLRKTFADDQVDVEYVKKLMTNYKSNPEDWLHFSTYMSDRYTRSLIDEGNGKYNLILLCWAESKGSAIHSHSNSHCFMKCLDGELIEAQYEWPDEQAKQEMIEKRVSSIKENEVVYINDEIGLHSIRNGLDSQPTFSLHCYVPPYSKCQTFSQKTGQSQVASMVFDSKFGELDD